MQPELVLFDVGGVLVEISGAREFAGMLGGVAEEQMWRTWLESAAVRRFERGQCDVDTFGREIVAELGLPVTPAYFCERFATWPGHIYPGALARVAAVRERVQVACLSNSNELHWEGPMRAFGLHEAFDHVFVSHKMGCLKPDPEAFAYVVERVAVTPDRIVFMDDNALNVDAARAAGLTAHRVRGLAEVDALLGSLGL